MAMFNFPIGFESNSIPLGPMLLLITAFAASIGFVMNICQSE